ncbi:uroporphyrin-III C-methyltransferase [Gloeomargarita lithophora Alchichica-D10]|uniref:uroporphyrinogen-III C-methyltransferase n=1 Tax=Gloeomargarita lithophora Alchichica-D10 TaxID=1188229 RepID=A0A1J0A9U8_9CYAN|nr:uroporphyrinogen-III C-methyltransferase [Gloeomargarita lithophora]APB32716.1 uroporphyrin-III C-methyltransferase [Gloeomargarita lithophora Alchichica-D10]
MTGTVYLVGAGPGDPGLLTLKGKMLLELAEVVIYDALVSPPILAMINPQAERVFVGKYRGWHSLPQAQITELLVTKAREYQTVVRLKAGDPFIFGRGGEEEAGLQEAGIAVQVVPGISAGLAVGFPLTHRQVSSSVVLVTGHEAVEKSEASVNWAALAQGADTLVIYMGMHRLAQITAALMRGGRAGETPVCVVQWGTWPQERRLFGTLATIHDLVTQAGFTAPAMVVVGEVVRLQRL